MIRLRAAAVIVLSLPALSGQAPTDSTQARSSKTWVGHYQDIEEYLRTAECVTMNPLGANMAARCKFRPGGPVARMAWRPLPPGVHRGFRESYKAEIAAYELDKLLKLDMVPPTVEREIQGNKGAAQQWVENIVDATDSTAPTPETRAHWEDQLVRMNMFDNLIGNRDRNLRNMLRDGAWNLILIDQTRAFGEGTELYGKLDRIDETLWAKIDGLTRKQLDAALGAWLTETEIKAILDRRDAMRAAIKPRAK
jgi:hypothetical protein